MRPRDFVWSLAGFVTHNHPSCLAHRALCPTSLAAFFFQVFVACHVMFLLRCFLCACLAGMVVRGGPSGASGASWRTCCRGGWPWATVSASTTSRTGGCVCTCTALHPKQWLRHPPRSQSYHKVRMDALLGWGWGVGGGVAGLLLCDSMGLGHFASSAARRAVVADVTPPPPSLHSRKVLCGCPLLVAMDFAPLPSNLKALVCPCAVVPPRVHIHQAVEARSKRGWVQPPRLPPPPHTVRLSWLSRCGLCVAG
jgi:hypothetical protein